MNYFKTQPNLHECKVACEFVGVDEIDAEHSRRHAVVGLRDVTQYRHRGDSWTGILGYLALHARKAVVT